MCSRLITIMFAWLVFSTMTVAVIGSINQPMPVAEEHGIYLFELGGKLDV